MVNNPCWFVMLKSNKFFFSPPNRSPTLSINQRQTLTWKVTRTCCIIGTTESNNFSWVVTYVCNLSVLWRYIMSCFNVDKTAKTGLRV